MNKAKQTALSASGKVTPNCPITSATINEPATPPRLKRPSLTRPSAWPAASAANSAISGAACKMWFRVSMNTSGFRILTGELSFHQQDENHAPGDEQHIAHGI